MAKRHYSPDEWELLLNAPHWVRIALMAAERGTISAQGREAKALDEFLSGYESGSPLVKQIIAGQEDADDKLKGNLKDAERMLGQVHALLERTENVDEGDAVRDLLMQAGEAVASEVREAIIGDSTSSKEEKALARIEAALEATEAEKSRRQEAAAAAEAKKLAERERKAAARAEAKRKREEAERAEAKKKAAETEAKRKAGEARRAEAKKKAEEAEAKKKAEKAEAKKKAEEAEAKKKAEKAEAEAKRKAGEARRAEAMRKVEEAKKKEAEAEAKKKAAEAEAEKKAAEEAAAVKIYVVKSGDTLSGIAKQMYGKAARWPEIFEANRDVIDKPNLIRPGWKLRIPD